MVRIRELGARDLGSLPDPCRSCLFWEVETAPRGAASDRDAAADSKMAWWQAVELEQPVASRAACQGDRLVGFALAAESSGLPRTRRLPAAPHDDALVLALLWVAPDARGAGAARTLLQSLLREAVRRQRRAVEAYGSRVPGLRCTTPVEALEALGFSVVSEHPTTPLLRLELRQTVTWAHSVQGALERVVSALGRRERRSSVPAHDAAVLPRRRLPGAVSRPPVG